MYDRGESIPVVFIETQWFTNRVQKLDLEESLDQLQQELIKNPSAGDLDPGTGGLRKIRMADSARGMGKRGGARVHYLWLPNHELIYLLFVYKKRELGVLAPSEKNVLKGIVEQLRKEWDQVR